jgi:hypothetical protein
VRAKLEAAAKRNKRSLSMEITSRLDTTIALDDFMAEREAGTHAEVYDMLQSVWADNDRLAENGEQTFGTAYAIIDKLLDEKLDDLLSKLSLEKRGDTPSPTAKRPSRKQSRPLGMDQAEWEAKRRKKLTVLDTGVRLDTDMEIPTSVKPERRIRRREEDK